MSLLTLRQLDVTPPGYWRYPRYGADDSDDIPPERRFIVGGDFQDLVKKVAEFRIINSLPLGKPEEEIPDWICRHTEAACRPASPAKAMPGVKVDGRHVARFLMAAKEWVKSDEIVSQEEAETRAEQCAGCQWNVEIIDGNCFGCFGLMAKIMQIIGQRQTRMDSCLKFCGKCGCSLPVVAFTPMHVLDRAHANSDFAGVETGQVDNDGTRATCWRGK
jgi:hypothetical protein